ncbi:hypothetical protein LIER_25639 [Lithospermum erythrorhizon]|uniref:Uncharacterized protein n=1 Tax=Lithospermum erythrorhizon TaxID=34254 RepID=A0AAV3RBD2_LITER
MGKGVFVFQRRIRSGFLRKVVNRGAQDRVAETGVITVQDDDSEVEVVLEESGSGCNTPVVVPGIGITLCLGWYREVLPPIVEEPSLIGESSAGSNKSYAAAVRKGVLPGKKNQAKYQAKGSVKTRAAHIQPVR